MDLAVEAANASAPVSVCVCVSSTLGTSPMEAAHAPSAPGSEEAAEHAVQAVDARGLLSQLLRDRGPLDLRRAIIRLADASHRARVGRKGASTAHHELELVLGVHALEHGHQGLRIALAPIHLNDPVAGLDGPVRALAVPGLQAPSIRDLNDEQLAARSPE